ncbi:hypothetical protein [Salmonella phage PKM.Hi.22.6]|nr:hypothetical protein [Salmonella phage PKM.Hi.22.6]
MKTHAPIRFTQTEHDTYKRILSTMRQLYPFVMGGNKPLPLHPHAIERMKNDPYLRYSDEELETFFRIWIQRREYALQVCILQHYYCDAGTEVSKIPDATIADRAYQVAQFYKNVDLSTIGTKK